MQTRISRWNAMFTLTWKENGVSWNEFSLLYGKRAGREASWNGFSLRYGGSGRHRYKATCYKKQVRPSYRYLHFIDGGYFYFCPIPDIQSSFKVCRNSHTLIFKPILYAFAYTRMQKFRYHLIWGDIRYDREGCCRQTVSYALSTAGHLPKWTG